jgi:glycosyltransferase involved in cell wall biosynthesis
MLITIITPCLNRRETIGEAIESVRSQDWSEVEHVVVDGGSTDGTLDVLARYPHLRVVSEPDRGLYDAINKGIRLARGTVLGHLNSDDIYVPDIFGKIAEAFAADSDVGSVCGGAQIFTSDGPEHRVSHTINAEPVKMLRSSDIIRGVPITNARFFRRAVYEKIGGYDIRYRMAADRDFLMRLLLAGTKRATVRDVVYKYRSHPGSLTLSGRASRELLCEYRAISLDRLAERDDRSDARQIYRRWHAWASAMVGRAELRSGNVAGALQCAVSASIRDPLWPLRVLPQAVGHMRHPIA